MRRIVACASKRAGSLDVDRGHQAGRATSGSGSKGGPGVEITKDTKVSDILGEYGDIAEVMEVFGIKRVARYSVRRFITKALTVERAARVHRLPLDEFLTTLRAAVAQIPPA